MHTWTRLVAVLSVVTAINAQNLILTNDDGWAVAQIRAQNDALNAAGFNVVLSAPAENESGQDLRFNASDTRLNYVNSFPVDAVRFGIQTLAPEFFGSAPDFVVSGPNVGNNLGSGVTGSGTVGAACEAALEGIPSTAFSGDTASQVSYTTLDSSPNSQSSLAARLYSTLTVTFVQTLLASSARPVLPPGVTLNVNYPSTSGCSAAADYSWVFTRLTPNSSAVDVETCGSDHLPDETSVVDRSGCFASVTVINATTKTDVDAATQGAVLARLTGLVTCLPS
ncbi:Acid phosphatase [Grifola frondosa]|uniref:Acid phosphatase n=1 Tax=Grifola frondosa TaxID=5627 RepID=A0A1C7MDD6_GRIFR|nr:Acid phosphatase [Grifola frondosa]